MSQISPPIRILLIAVIGLVAVYMLFLKPKTEEVPPVAATPAAATPVPAKDPNGTTQSGPGSAVNTAVRGADNASARADAAAGGAIAETEGGVAPAAGGATTSAPVAGAPASGSRTLAPVTKETLASLPKDIRRPVRKHKVIVLLFYNNRSADDRAVRHALRSVNRYGGQVFVDAHGIKSVSRYQAITRGVDVEQSPTVIVADRNLKAETLVGYVDGKTIDQAVADALLASGGTLIKNPYYRRIEGLCASAQGQLKTLPQPASAAALPAFFEGALPVAARLKKDVAAIRPAKKYRRFHKNFVNYMADTVGLMAAAQIQLKAKPAAGMEAVKTLSASGRKLDKRFIAKNGAHGMTSCF